MNGWMKRPYFIGPLQPRPGVQKAIKRKLHKTLMYVKVIYKDICFNVYNIQFVILSAFDTFEQRFLFSLYFWSNLFGICQESYLHTLTANYEYSRGNRENLLLPIQMQLSKKVKTFC